MLSTLFCHFSQDYILKIMPDHHMLANLFISEMAAMNIWINCLFDIVNSFPNGHLDYVQSLFDFFSQTQCCYENIL